MLELASHGFGRSVVSCVVVFGLIVVTPCARTSAQPPPPSGPVIVVPQPEPAVPTEPAYGSYAVGDPYRAQALQQRLSYLVSERSQYRLGGPIVMLSIGGGAVLLGGMIAWALWSTSSWDGRSVGERNAATAFTIIAIGGGVMALAGALKLSRRIRARRQYDPEIRQIREELRMMRPVYGARFEYDIGLGGARLGIRF